MRPTASLSSAGAPAVGHGGERVVRELAHTGDHDDHDGPAVTGPALGRGHGGLERAPERPLPSRPMDLYVAAVCFPVIFIGELPDKTMFADLVTATRGHPGRVWAGAEAAFAVHVAIATTIGVALFGILPKRALDAIVAAFFIAGAVYAWHEDGKEEGPLVATATSHHGALLTSFMVIFLAE